MVISPHDLIGLPVHDARLVGFTVEPTNDGFLTASLKIKINSEELVHPMRELGITSSDLCVIFCNCWQVKTNFLGCTTTVESISTLEIEEESGLKQKLLSSGVGKRSMIHFQITGSNGSQLDIIADGVSLNS